MAFCGGASVAGALFAGMTSSGLTLVIRRGAVAVSRCLILCIAIATAFALPAAVVGYDVVFALSQIGGGPSPAWREVFAGRGVHR
jgi:hypothetical protein